MAAVLMDNGVMPSATAPQQLDFSLPEARDHILVAKEQLRRPFDGGVSTWHNENESVSVTIPASDKLLDPTSVFFSADLQMRNAANDAMSANTAEIRGSVRRLFSKLKIESNVSGAVFEEIDDVNLIEEYIIICKYGNEYASRVLQKEGLFDSRYEADALLGSSDEKYKWSKQIDNTPIGDTSSVDRSANIIKYAKLTDPNTDAGSLATDAKGEAAANHARTQYGNFLADCCGADGRRVVWHFDCSGFLNQQRYIPLQYLGGIRITLTFAPKATVVESKAGTGQVRMKNMHVNYDLVSASTEVKDALHAQHTAGNMRLLYDTWVSRTAPAGQTAYSHTFDKPVHQLKDVLVLQRVSANISSGTANSFASSGAVFTDAQLVWNDLRYPAEKITSYVEAYQYFLRSLKADPHLGTSDVPSLAEYYASKFMLLWNLETLPYEDSFTAVSTKNQKSAIINLTLSGATIKPQFLMRYSRIAVLNPDDSVNIIE